LHTELEARRDIREKKNMKIQNRKSTISASLILLLAVSMIVAGIASVNAATTLSTRAFLSANPNPVQVGTTLVVSFWVEPIPPTAADIFHGFMVEITKPDGSKETKGPFDTSPLGSQYFAYVPTQVGTYQFVFNYPGETFAGNVNFAASQSPVTTVTVQNEPVPPSFNSPPISNDFWTRPVNAQNREWFSVTGNWLMRNYNATYRSFGEVLASNPYSQAARAPHVMWTKELTLGGLVGGEYGAEGYYTGQSYEPKLTPPIILNGKLYYNIYPSSLFGGQGTGFACADLRTGEVLWTNPNYTITAAQILKLNSGNEQGAVALLWQVESGGIFGPPVATYRAFDAFTGRYMFTFANGMPGTMYFGSDGTMYINVLNVAAGWNALWNSTKAMEANFMYLGTEPGITMFEPSSGTFQWATGVQWNVTVPIRSVTLPEDGQTYFVSTGFMSGIVGNVLVASAGTVTDARLHAGYDLTTGKELWVADRTNDMANYIVFASFGEGKYCAWDLANMRWVCYDAQTGNKLWVSDEAVYPWGAFLPNSNGGTISNGMLYYGGMDGYEHAIRMSDGKEVWKFYAGDTTETAYGTYPMGSGPIVAGGVVYCGIGEHSPTHPLYRGGKLFALDQVTGNLIWEMNGFFSLSAIADGYLLTQNQYDNEIYCFGKGPSATTVEAPKAGVVTGSNIVISGKVTDQSSGQPGTPAIADSSMGGYMAFIKEQQQCPADLRGVPVKLTAQASDGSTIDLGTVVSDASGYFSATWAPTNAGMYHVTANFQGTDSYGSSFAETSFYANAAQSSSQGTTTPAASNTDMYILVSTIVIVIVIAIAVVVISRKK
jgi:hypothetical protein